METLIEARDIEKIYRTRGLFAKPNEKKALRGINFSLRPMVHCGLAGASGSGKTTLARILVLLDRPSAGNVYFQGRAIPYRGARRLREFRRQVQMIFQHPFQTLNPGKNVLHQVTMGLEIHGIGTGRQAEDMANEWLARVGLEKQIAKALPCEISGGECQRVAIARSLALSPRLLIADEPTSSLDVTSQSLILDLLKQLGKEVGLTYLIISHDLRILHNLVDELAIIHDGLIVESGETREVFCRPVHSHTRELIQSLPSGPPSPG